MNILSEYIDSSLFHEEIDSLLQKLFEGGAFGHLAHPFEDIGLTFGDVKDMVESVLSGKVEAMEKIDGQQISFSWKNGKLVGARNKRQLSGFGAEALDAEQMRSFFSQNEKLPPEIAQAFYLAMLDLEEAISKLPPESVQSFFQEGKRFMNTEIVSSETTNIIPYYKDYLVFHGLIEYDEEGSPVSQIKDSGKKLSALIDSVGQSTQSKYQIKGPNKVVLKNFEELPEKRNELLSLLKQIQGGSPDTMTLQQQQEQWWKLFVLNKAKSMDYRIPQKAVDMLAARWGKLEKANNTLPRINSLISDEEFKKWIIHYDKNEHAAQYRKNVLPYEMFFMKLGAEIMANVSGLLTASPVQTAATLAKKINTDALRIKGSKNIEDLKRLKKELERLENIGRDKIVGSEGIVFSHKGKLFKLTGVFQPVHHILSILKYRTPDKLDEGVICEGGGAVHCTAPMENKNLKPTIENALNLWKIPNLKYELVGSHQKPLMNDVDLGVDIKEMEKMVGASSADKDNFWNKVQSFFAARKPKDIPEPSFKINKGFEQVHLSAPIVGQPGEFVQIDLILGDIEWLKDRFSGAPDSQYKAVYRNVLLAVIFSVSKEPTQDPNVFKRYQITNKGLQSLEVVEKDGKREKRNIQTVSGDMNYVAEFLFGPGTRFSDINTVEKLYKLLDSPSFRYKDKKEDILKAFNETLIKLKLPLVKEQ